jgi:pimeloyl-ACP methyl ester carboxylesterase
MYTLFQGHKELLIFFPAAGTGYDDYTGFLKSVKKAYDIIFVQKGYYGLSYQGDINDQYSTKSFTDSLFKYFKDTIACYKKVTLVGQSFGTMQALSLKRKLPHARLVLISPTLSEKRFAISPLDRYTFTFLLKTSAGRLVLNILQQRRIKSFAKGLLTRVFPDVVRPIRRAGVISYLHCLSEIVQSGIIDPSGIESDTIFIIGEHDSFLKKLCIQDTIRARKKTVVIDSNHSVAQNNWKVVLHNLKAY